MALTFRETRQRLQSRLRLIDELESMMRDDPHFSNELRSILGVQANPNTARKGGRKMDVASIDAVANLLSGGGWVSTPDLIESSGLGKPRVFQALKNAPERFESRQDPANARRMQWRLKPA